MDRFNRLVDSYQNKTKKRMIGVKGRSNTCTFSSATRSTIRRTGLTECWSSNSNDYWSTVLANGRVAEIRGEGPQNKKGCKNEIFKRNVRLTITGQTEVHKLEAYVEPTWLSNVDFCFLNWRAQTRVLSHWTFSKSAD